MDETDRELGKEGKEGPWDKIRWFHVLAAILLPAIAFPLGIYNVIYGKYRSGLVMAVISGIIISAIFIISIISFFAP